MGLKGTLGKIRLGKNAQAPQPAAAAPIAPPVAAPIPWDAGRFRIQIKLAKSRIEIQHGKKENEMDQQRYTIAEHLRNNKEPLARIHAERLLREQTQIQAFDVLRTFLELLTNSHNIFNVQKDFDTAGSDIKESVATVVFASSRLNVPELQNIVEMFRNHFGAAIIDPIKRLEGPHVKHINPTIARNLEGGAPDGHIILQELTKIASDYGVQWIPPPEFNDLDGRAPNDPMQYRPVPLYQTGGGGPPHGPSAPPGDGYGGGGGGFSYAPTNIPGHNPGFPASAPYGNIPGYDSIANTASPAPSAPSAPSVPDTGPYDPSMGAPGTLYPTGPPTAPPDDGYPPAPPPASFTDDDDLGARLRNLQGRP